MGKQLVFAVRPEIRIVVPIHHDGCKFPFTNKERDCRCPKYFYVTPGRLRISAKTDAWEVARTRARQFENDYDPANVEAKAKAAVTPTSVDDAFQYLLDAKRAAGAGNAVLGKFRTLRKELVAFIAKWNQGKQASEQIYFVHQLNLDVLTAWQKTWDSNVQKLGHAKMSGLTKEKRKGNLTYFFDFCLERGFIRNTGATVLARGRLLSKDNPARFLPVIDKAHAPLVRQPLSDRLYKAILDLCDSYESTLKTVNRREIQGLGHRLKLLCRLMYSVGFSITDAVIARRDRLKTIGVGCFFDVNRKKTGKPVYVELHPAFAKELLAVPNSNPAYFFWSGEGSPDHAASYWQRVFAKLRLKLDSNMLREELGTDHDGKLIYPTWHCFRNSFAANLFAQGADVPEVATLLGDSDAVVRKHYYKFSPKLQAKANEAVRRTWTEAPSLAPTTTRLAPHA
jgi:integrase/recombinase XerD